MRVVVRVYRDENTKPHHDEYKTDCEDMRDVLDVANDLGTFLEVAYEELEQEAEDNVVEGVDS
jgi:hypothetical protein